MISIRLNLLVSLLIAFIIHVNAFAAENVTIETKNDNFFENLISDTLYLLDPDLKKIIADDFDNVVSNSKFALQVNSWKPRANPKHVQAGADLNGGHRLPRTRPVCFLPCRH